MIALRDYQDAARSAVASKFLTDGKNRLLVALPTGTGKTVLFASLWLQSELAAWRARWDVRRQKVLVVAHREELLNQAAAKIAGANPDLIVEVEQAERRASPMADVVVASIATLAASGGRRLARLDPEEFRIVIVDEAHHAVATSYRRTLAHFGFVPPPDAPDEGEGDEPEDAIEVEAARAVAAAWSATRQDERLLLGVTATPTRGDAIGLEHVFQEIAYAMTLREAIARGWLADIVPYKVDTGVSLERVRVKRGDFDAKQLAQAVNTPQRNALAVAAWRKLADGLKTIAFTTDVQHAHDVAEMFRAADVRAAAVSGETPTEERARLVAELGDERSDLMVLANCAVLTEGTDIPAVSCIVHLKPTKSTLLYTQMTGRATRPHPRDPVGPPRAAVAPATLLKPRCVVIDLVDLSTRHALATAPQLMGLPPAFDCKGQSAYRAVRELEALQARHPSLDVSAVLSLADAQAAIRRIDAWAVPDLGKARTWVSLNWMKDGEQRYRLQYPHDGGHERLSVEQNLLGKWDVVVKTIGRMMAAVGEAVREVRESTLVRDVAEAQGALHLAEQWVRQHRPTAASLKSKDAKWRTADASDKQLWALRKRGVPLPRPTACWRCAAPWAPGRTMVEGVACCAKCGATPITKGQASDLLDLATTRDRRP